jgi:hypothetical protein
MIGTCNALRRKGFPQQSTEAALHAIPDDGAANLLGYGDTVSHLGVAVLPVPYQQDESRHGRAAAMVRRQEIRAAAEALQIPRVA